MPTVVRWCQKELGGAGEYFIKMTLSLEALAKEWMFGVNLYFVRDLRIQLSALPEGHFQRGEKEEEFPTKNWYLEVYL